MIFSVLHSRITISVLGFLMMLGLTACPHHIEKMIDSVAPPKGYKPGYSTSEVSLTKLKNQSTNTSETKNQDSSKQSSDFDTRTLTAFPYTTATTRGMTGDSNLFASLSKNFPRDFAKKLPNSQSSNNGDSSALREFGNIGEVFAGKIPDTKTLDSLHKKLITTDFPANLPQNGLNLEELQKRFALDSTLLSGNLSSEEMMKRVRSITDGIKDSSTKTLLPSSEPSFDELAGQTGKKNTAKKSTGKTVSKGTNANNKSTAKEYKKGSAPETADELERQSAELKRRSEELEAKSNDLKKQGEALKERGKEMFEAAQEQAREAVSGATSGAMEQAFQMIALYRAKAEALAKERAARERTEAEAYRKIAEEEERAAKKLAEKPPIMPITVDIRSISTNRYPDEVELQVAVMDTAGRFITGLAPPYFQGKGNYREYWRALTDSSSQTNDRNAARVRSFEVLEVREAVQDTHAVAFVLDHSPSMGETRALRLQEAVARTLGVVKRQDFISVIKFTSKIKVEVPLTNDTIAYRRGFLLDGLDGYRGGTALYDGAFAGIEELKKAPASATKIVVLFSDGGDNSSKKKLRDVYQAAKREGVRIFTISYGFFDDIDKMHDLAIYTGGKLYQLYSAREFPFAFADVYKSLKNYYRVRYKPVEAASKHAVQLRLAVPELVSVSTATAEYDRSIFTPLDSIGSVQLVNIEFETGKAIIQVTSMQQIRDFAAYIKRFPKMVVEVRGHTDDKGSEDLNQKLSEARAEAVRTALVQFGVQPSQLRTKGFGKTQPLVPNDSEDNRRKNRRTEFAIIEK